MWTGWCRASHLVNVPLDSARRGRLVGWDGPLAAHTNSVSGSLGVFLSNYALCVGELHVQSFENTHVSVSPEARNHSGDANRPPGLQRTTTTPRTTKEQCTMFFLNCLCK